MSPHPTQAAPLAALLLPLFLALLVLSPARVGAAPAEAARAETVPSSPAQAGGGTLTVVVDGLESDAGTVAFALYDSEADYLETPVRKGRLEIGAGDDGTHTCRWVLQDLPPGDYALSLYHDEDDDGELDKAAFGIPTEPYGFSNDARSTTGPPGWQKARFRFDGEDGGEDGEVRVRVR